MTIDPAPPTPVPTPATVPAAAAPARPILVVVDDDPQVLRAVQRDMRRHFSADYRVLAAGGGAEAYELLTELERRDEEPALLLSDQRMPGMNGVDLLRKCRMLFPGAKRVLLTAYADTDAAIAAINEARAHTYLLKPWDPPDERLFPALEELLADWRATHPPEWSLATVVGARWSPASHQIRDFLTRQRVPFRFLDAEEDDGRALLDRRGLTGPLPVVTIPGVAEALMAPSAGDLAVGLGLTTTPSADHYDLVIVGAGPAGLSAAVYGGSEGLCTLLVDRDGIGGQAGTTSMIRNYLGFPDGVTGQSLAERGYRQVRIFGVDVAAPAEVVGIDLGATKTVHLADGRSVTCPVLLLSTGVAYNRLDIPGADRLEGAGLYYGAARTEIDACAGTEVYVVGGANSAGQAAVYFSEKAAHVTMLIRGDSIAKGMSSYLIDEIEAHPNIAVRVCTRLTAVGGDERLETVTIADDAHGTSETLPAGAVFTFIGARPHTDWLDPALPRDPDGFLLSGPDLPADPRTGRPAGWTLEREPYLLESAVPGVFVAGDVRHRSVKRVTSGVGEGSIAVQFIHRYLGTS